MLLIIKMMTANYQVINVETMNYAKGTLFTEILPGNEIRSFKLHQI